MKKKSKESQSSKGQLRIGDHWNAITILALSQSNPLKAVAEFVENSIDAGAKKVHIFRGKKGGEPYLRIVDDGRGIPKDGEGVPDFKYVATHICNSIKRQFKANGTKGIQGEFGIGLLSFWTVGEQLTLRSSAINGDTHQMVLRKGQAGYAISKSRSLLASSGTELLIQPLLSGIKQLNGEKLQWFIGSELRNRLIEHEVEIHIHDLISRNEYLVEPQRYEGRKLMLHLPQGVAKAEIYLNSASSGHRLSLYRMGTRVFEDLQSISDLDPAIWGSGYFAGFIEWPELNLTPGNRLGAIQDEKYQAMVQALLALESILRDELIQLKRAEEERASKSTHVALHKALKDALESLPPEEYDWFDVRSPQLRPDKKATENSELAEAEILERTTPGDKKAPAQPAFFEFPGPLQSVRISPASSLVSVQTSRKLRAVARDRKGIPVSEGLNYEWKIIEGAGVLSDHLRQEVSFNAPADPGITTIQLEVTQGDVQVSGQAVMTVTDSIVATRVGVGVEARKGLPSFTYERSPGQLWRSRMDVERNLILVNSGHRDFVFAASRSQLKLRYLIRLFSKELVLANFQGLSAAEILDRQIEVSLRAEEFLK